MGRKSSTFWVLTVTTFVTLSSLFRSAVFLLLLRLLPCLVLWANGKMMKHCNFRGQCQLLDHPILSSTITKTNFPLRNSISVRNPPCFISLIRRQQSITCAGKSKKRGGSEPSRQLMLELASMAALSLKILPQPLNLLIGEFAQRDGNGVLLELLNVLRGRGFDGWRRKRRTNRKLLWIVSVLLTCGLGLLSWKFSKLDLFLRASCFCLVGLSMIQLWRKKAFTEWVLGFLLGIVLLSSRMGKDDVKFWVEKLRIRSPVAQIVIGNKNRSKRKWGKAW